MISGNRRRSVMLLDACAETPWLLLVVGVGVFDVTQFTKLLTN